MVLNIWVFAVAILPDCIISVPASILVLHIPTGAAAVHKVQ